MKKFFNVTIKILIFTFLWIVAKSLVAAPVYYGADVAVLIEILLFAAVVIETSVFWLIEKRKITIIGHDRLVKSVAVGLIAGLVWTIVSAVIPYFIGSVSIDALDGLEHPALWMLAAVIGAVVQELLVRGYVYQLIKKKYNVIPALLVSTVLFTLFHIIYFGIFDDGIIAVIDVIITSLAMTFALEYTGSLLTPIIMHGIHNLVDVAVYGTAALDGKCIATSDIVAETFVNIAIMAVFFILWRRKKYMSEDNDSYTVWKRIELISSVMKLVILFVMVVAGECVIHIFVGEWKTIIILLSIPLSYVCGFIEERCISKLVDKVIEGIYLKRFF